jgi:hypothetical protein
VHHPTGWYLPTSPRRRAVRCRRFTQPRPAAQRPMTTSRPLLMAMACGAAASSTPAWKCGRSPRKLADWTANGWGKLPAHGAPRFPARTIDCVAAIAPTQGLGGPAAQHRRLRRLKADREQREGAAEAGDGVWWVPIRPGRGLSDLSPRPGTTSHRVTNQGPVATNQSRPTSRDQPVATQPVTARGRQTRWSGTEPAPVARPRSLAIAVQARSFRDSSGSA